MPRPAEYGPRVDTKVRLRADHARLLTEAQEARGVGRNRLIEIALDAFFGIRSTAPKLKHAPSDPVLSETLSPNAKSTRRVAPRIGRVGQAMADQAEANGGRLT